MAAVSRSVMSNAFELEIHDEVNAGRQHLELAVQVKNHGDAHAVHVKHRRRSTRVVVLATLQGNARTRRHHMTVLEHHVVEQRLALKRNRRGHDADQPQALDTLSDTSQNGCTSCSKSAAPTRPPGMAPIKSGSRAQLRPRARGARRAWSSMRPQCPQYPQAHIDPRKRELHGSALSVVNHRNRSKRRPHNAAGACM